MLVEDRAWTSVLRARLEGRRSIHRELGVDTSKELHANDLYKGRGSFLPAGSGDHLSTVQREATGRIMLSHLAQADGFHVVTLAMSGRSKPRAYRHLISWLDTWAGTNDTTVMVLYDGRQGYPPSSSGSAEQVLVEWETALRDASPLRAVHRDLPIATRRVIEDVVMQDSRDNQLIQAADLIAYGAFHKHAHTRAP
ncbi:MULTISPECIES: DUF3800 domain-containing protein [unclassified Actinomyces]|uniref:DUF3800 domain-containing protein n=1 Tax=unclassified Actinomyces TaxID=2609248 RepID=UPI00201784BE|nr:MULTISPECIES: DUF3800 domain-containing protein [unclassified Actinomyces]